MRIDLPIWDLQEKGWKVVEADLVDVAPHLSGTFAVHKNPWNDGCTWTVSNVETGSRVPIGFIESFTKQESIEAARRVLEDKTECQYQAALEKLRPKLPADSEFPKNC